MSGYFSYLYGFSAFAARIGKAPPKFLSGMLISLVIGISATSVNAQNYITNGVGSYTEFNEPSLLIRLELESPVTDPVGVMAADTNKKLAFRLMQNRSPRAWSKIWIQNLSINNSPDTLTTQTNDLITMTQAIEGTLRTGDLVEFERVASDLTIMSINGNEIADFETTGFFEFLLTAFIGPVPPSSELKNQLLAGGQRFGQEAILFDSLGYTEQRAAQIASWGTPQPEDDTPSIPEEESVEETGAEAETEVASAELFEETEEAAEDDSIAANASVNTVATAEAETTPESNEEEEISNEEDEAPVMITAESLLAAQNYQRSVLQAVYRELEYPSSAQRRNREGSLRLSIAINRNGMVSSVEVVDGAEFDVFDEAAIDAIENASPFDPLPEGTMEIPMLLEIPIAFRLQ